MSPKPVALRSTPLGDRAVRFVLGDRIDADVTARVLALATRVRNCGLAGIVDVVPAYTAVVVHFDPRAWLRRELAPGVAFASALDAQLATAPTEPESTPHDARERVIPVAYGGEHGPDLAHVAAHCGLTPSEVVARHHAATYTVAFLGFAPGFPYLLGLDAGLATPRRATPRTRVAAGAVGIAGAQTGIYPSATPGGWQIIGCTPRGLFDVTREPATWLQAGDRVRFTPIEAARFHDVEVAWDA